MTCDIQIFYLNTIMKRFKYMKIPISLLPLQVIQEYKLRDIEEDGYVYMEVRKGMYGLPQAGKIANKQLQEHLAKYRYYPVTHMPGLWRHTTRNIVFTLVANDFGIKYDANNMDDIHHLLSALKDKYTITEDWNGKQYCGLSLNWNYPQSYVNISMPGYVQAALHKFQHPHPSRPQHAPHKWAIPQYGKHPQLSVQISDAPKVSSSEIKRIQQIVGTLLYYARAVDSTMLMALNAIAAQQAHATTETAAVVVHLLNYCATHPNAIVRYHASEMQMHVHSNASYLSELHALSRVGGHFFMSTKTQDPSQPPKVRPPNNGTIHTE